MSHIFTDDGKQWKLIPVMPVKPIIPDNPNNIIGLGISEQAQYAGRLEAAKANALPVVNPEVITTDEVPGEPGKPYERGKLYEWPGTWEFDIIQGIDDNGVVYFTHRAKLIAPQQPQAEKTDNELIAEFMGMYQTHPEWFKNRKVRSNEILQFDISWNDLMPVVEKIAAHIYESWPDSNGYKEIVHYDRAYPRTFGMIDNEGKWMVRINRMPLEQESTLIQATYNAVVEWIKAHNAKTKQL